MRILVASDSPYEKPDVVPALTLVPDGWDDYGRRTTFHAYLWMDQENPIELPSVKVMQLGMKGGRTSIPSLNMHGLPDDFASLGADFGYYERIFSLPSHVGDDLLQSMRDIAVDAERHERFSLDDTYNISLARLAPAKDALERIRRLRKSVELSHQNAPQDLSIVIASLRSAAFPVKHERLTAEEEPSPETPPLKIRFAPLLRPGQTFEPEELIIDFSGPAELPSNLVALVGPNGTGKTTLLSGLALALFFGGQGGESRGRVEIESGSVREVIFISFSAYDNFEIPQTQALSFDARSELASQGYVYVGLRKLSQNEVRAEERDRPQTLRSIREIDEDFVRTLDHLKIVGPSQSSLSEDRCALFAKSVSALFEDPSLQAIAEIPIGLKPLDVIDLIKPLFQTMSTGHKAIFSMIASLCTQLNANSLVLIDEPEAHLHPPLVGSLLRIVRMLLEAFDANAVVATHSPVVVQETLGDHVIKFHRVANRTNWEVHPSQTFGENIATLTRSTFGLPAARADFIGVLRELTKEEAASLENIEVLFGERGLSSPARAQVLRLLSARRLGQLE